MLIDINTCPWVRFQIICGAYPIYTYVFSSPVGLRKFLTRVPVVCNYLLALIYCFAWSKISFNLFAQDFLYWFFIYVFFHLMYQCSLTLKLVLGCGWNISVGHIQTGNTYLLSPHFCGSSWWGIQLCGCTCNHQLIYWSQVDNPMFFLIIVVYISFISGRGSTINIRWFINISRNSLFCEIVIKVWWSQKSLWIKLHQCFVVKFWCLYPII